MEVKYHKSLYRYVVEFLQKNRHLAYFLWSTKAYLLKRRGVKVFSIEGIKEYCLNNDLPVQIIEDENEREVCLPEYFEGQQQQIFYYKSREVYVTNIPQAKIVGGVSAVFCGKKALYDVAAYDISQRYYLDQLCPLNSCGVLFTIRNKCLYLECEESNTVIEEGLFLIGVAHNNYFHFVFEILSQLADFDRINEYQKLPIIIDAGILQISQFVELLKKVNINKHPIIALDNYTMYQVNNLIVHSPNTCLPINIKKGHTFIPTDIWMTNLIIDNIRNSVIVEDKKKPFRKLFLSRKNIQNARIENEKEVQQEFKKHGFEIICPEEMSFMEQVNVFREATWVVGATGAAFTNIIFCKEGTKISIFCPDKELSMIYASLAYACKLFPIFLDAKMYFENDCFCYSRWLVDVEYCKRFLNESDHRIIR